ncbi:hypothetical protein HNR23_002334 [Nocardiopsis mwathae]|uniref:DUF2975 domain-containing protein n=1 Tax=Nocardiopsis mwathae TaxID=1472723 RepID=A0A7W9YHP0_9ACTN|nr:DUF2975 domain-containing protein [Nocardiopsis mwathae]MBB6172274.1 hypothetical protein [Nocardiopsis mwathae]
MTTPSEQHPKTWLGPLEAVARLATLGCGLLLAMLVLLGGATVTGLIPYALGVEAHVPASQIDGLRADPGALAPGVAFDGDVGLTLTGATSGQVALSMLPTVSALLFVLAGATILRQALRSAMVEGPFTIGVADRLRRLGQLAVIGGLVHALIVTVTDALLFTTVLPSGHDGIAWSFNFPAPTIVFGFGMLAVSEIVRHGVHLREEVEGTV